MVTTRFEITTIERLEAKAPVTALALGGAQVGGRPGGIAATVDTEAYDGKTITLGVSKLEGETEWIVDSFAVDGLPSWANGKGSRATALKRIEDAAIAEALDEAAKGVM